MILLPRNERTSSIYHLRIHCPSLQGYELVVHCVSYVLQQWEA